MYNFKYKRFHGIMDVLHIFLRRNNDERLRTNSI